MKLPRALCLTFAVLAAALALGCHRETVQAPAEGSITNYVVRGVVKSLKLADREVVIQHEEIPTYMMAMTMPFTVRDTNELQGVKAGDGVTFRLRVTADDGWIDQLKVVSNAPPATATTATATSDVQSKPNPPAGFRVLPNVPELKAGDVVPNYVFTNQAGARFALSDFRGQALAVTFIFTRCPFPLFCPKVTDGFSQVQKILLGQSGGPTNWHLLTLSFDPEFDTPQVMKNYGLRWHADPRYWTLATGGFDQIEPFAVSTGLYFGRDVSVANQNHNLRTLVISPDGKLLKNIMGNQWTAQELADAVVEAAQSKP